MTYDCDLIQDLLTLYWENLCSPASRRGNCPSSVQALLFLGFTQQCHFGAFGYGSPFSQAWITRRCVQQHPPTSRPETSSETSSLRNFFMDEPSG